MKIYVAEMSLFSVLQSLVFARTSQRRLSFCVAGTGVFLLPVPSSPRGSMTSFTTDAYRAGGLSDNRLSEQIDHIASEYSTLREILTLPPSYESLTECTELIHKIDQWEIDTLRQVKEAAEQIREKVRQRSETIATQRFEPEFQRLTDAWNASRQRSTPTDSDIQRLTKQLNDLKLQVEDSLLNTADIRTLPIDWTQHLQMITQRPTRRKYYPTMDFTRLSSARPRISLDARGADWHVLGAVSPINSKFLHYQHTEKIKHLSLIDMQGHQTSIPWFNDRSIWDIGWSSYLSQFVILADTELYTYDEAVPSNSIRAIDAVQPRRNGMEFLRCTCVHESIFIIYDERNSSIDEYNMQRWTKVRQYDNIVKQNELIISVASSEVNNTKLLAMTILDDRQQWHVELRDRALLLITSMALDRSEFNRRVISLANPTENWLVVHTGSKLLTSIDQNGQAMRTIDCAETIDLATYSSEKNCLVVLTQKSKLKFFDLSNAVGNRV